MLNALLVAVLGEARARQTLVLEYSLISLVATRLAILVIQFNTGSGTVSFESVARGIHNRNIIEQNIPGETIIYRRIRHKKYNATKSAKVGMNCEINSQKVSR